MIFWPAYLKQIINLFKRSRPEFHRPWLIEYLVNIAPRFTRHELKAIIFDHCCQLHNGKKEHPWWMPLNL